MLSTIVFVLCAYLCDITLAASTPIATSSIVSTVTSFSISTTRSVASISTSTTIFDSCSTTIGDDGEPSSYCLGGIAISTVPIYTTKTYTFTDVYTSIIGYTTIYNDVADPTSTPTGNTSPTQSSDVSGSVSASLTYIKSIAPGNQVVSSSASGSQSKTSSGASISGSAPSTENRSQSSASSDSGSGTSTGLKAALAVVAIVCVALVGGFIFFIVKRRKSKKAQQVTETDTSSNPDIEKPELQGSSAGSDTAVVQGKAELYSGDAHTVSGTSSPPSARFYEMHHDTKNLHEAHGTQRYEMAGTITSVHELDAGPPGYQYHAR